MSKKYTGEDVFGPSRQSHGRRLCFQHLEQEEELADSCTDHLVPRLRPQPSMPSDARKRRSIQGYINKNPWMSQLLTEKARRGWLDGAPDSPPAALSGTLVERRPHPPPSTPRPQVHHQSRTLMLWLLCRLPRCQMLRLFRCLPHLLLLRMNDCMPRPHQHPQPLPHLTFSWREIQISANDEVP